ncbi:MAG TPA: hypothetical protein VGR31_05380 [Planctomycetota bacterium]|jgi:hypothetical protein|nr:hypothetical protein [Planctomycetota bacterium]
MSPHTDFVDTRTQHVPGRPVPVSWDPRHAVFSAPERKRVGHDRAALCVQITLCIVVAALLFSVIAVPKLRAASSRADLSQPAHAAPCER